MSLNPLRNMPSVNELLDSPPLKRLVDRISHNVVVTTVGKVLDEVRSEVQSAAAAKTLPSVSELAERIAKRVLEVEQPAIRPVINATGVLLAGQLGGPPLADEAIEQLTTVAREYTTVGSVPVGRRGAPEVFPAEADLREITGAEAAWVANNVASATLLACAAVASGGEVVVARSELVDLGDGCGLVELARAGGAVLREVGSANYVLPEDYEGALSEETAALVRAEPDDFAIVGRHRRISLPELVEVGRGRGVPVFHLAPSAPLVDLEPCSGSVTSVREGIAAGADLVIFSGDRLLGGPRCGILAGRRDLICRIETFPTAGAFSAGRLTLAALAATLRLYRDLGSVQRGVPLLHLLSTSSENLRNRAERLAPQIGASQPVDRAEPVETLTYLGESRIPAHQLSTWCISVQPQGMSVDRLAAALRTGIPPVFGRPDGDRLLLDLRSVPPRQDHELVDAFAALGGES